jgi:hypothetical protein
MRVYQFRHLGIESYVFISKYVRTSEDANYARFFWSAQLAHELCWCNVRMSGIC